MNVKGERHDGFPLPDLPASQAIAAGGEPDSLAHFCHIGRRDGETSAIGGRP